MQVSDWIGSVIDRLRDVDLVCQSSYPTGNKTERSHCWRSQTQLAKNCRCR